MYLEEFECLRPLLLAPCLSLLFLALLLALEGGRVCRLEFREEYLDDCLDDNADTMEEADLDLGWRLDALEKDEGLEPLKEEPLSVERPLDLDECRDKLLCLDPRLRLDWKLTIVLNEPADSADSALLILG